jgi:hypothetical protein
LSVGIPTGGAESDRGMGKAVDRFHTLFDDHSAI